MQDKNKQHEEIIILQKLTLTPDSLAALRVDDFLNIMVAMLSKGFLVTCMNFIGT